MSIIREKSPSGKQDSFPPGESGVAAIIRAFDWSTTTLGPIAGWPTHLKSAVSLMLPAKAQIVLFWGPEFVALYNDAYAPTIGEKHPRALGQPARQNWAELWDDLEPLLRRVLDTGETVFAKGPPLLHRAARLPGERLLRHLVLPGSERFAQPLRGSRQLGGEDGSAALSSPALRYSMSIDSNIGLQSSGPQGEPAHLRIRSSEPPICGSSASSGLPTPRDGSPPQFAGPQPAGQ